jgi:hypothetical protein
MVGGLKVLHVCTFDRGGAANACVRLHVGLLDEGLDSKLLVKQLSKNLPQAFKFYPKSSSLDRINKLFNRFLYLIGANSDPILTNREIAHANFKQNLPPGVGYFSFPQTDMDITASPLYLDSDIIHLHWVAGFLDYESFFKKNSKPIVWTLHDMEPFQGGTHYHDKYYGVDNSGKPVPFNIPDMVLRKIKENFDVKRRALSNIPHLTIVSPSMWLRELSKKSTLFGDFPHFHIPYGLDTNVFKPRNKKFSKEMFNLPLDRAFCFLSLIQLKPSERDLNFFSGR